MSSKIGRTCKLKPGDRVKDKRFGRLRLGTFCESGYENNKPFYNIRWDDAQNDHITQEPPKDVACINRPDKLQKVNRCEIASAFAQQCVKSDTVSKLKKLTYDINTKILHFRKTKHKEYEEAWLLQLTKAVQLISQYDAVNVIVSTDEKSEHARLLHQSKISNALAGEIDAFRLLHKDQVNVLGKKRSDKAKLVESRQTSTSRKANKLEPGTFVVEKPGDYDSEDDVEFDPEDPYTFPINKDARKYAVRMFHFVHFDLFTNLFACYRNIWLLLQPLTPVAFAQLTKH
jgi:hypothetical protein